MSNPAPSDPPGSHDENHYGQLWLQSPRSSSSKHVIEMLPRLHMMKSLNKNMRTASIIWSIFGRAEMAPGFLSNSQVYSLYDYFICYLFRFPFLKCQVDTSDRSDMSAWHICLSFTPEANKTTQPLADALPPPPTASGDLEAQPYVQQCMVWLDGQKTRPDHLILIN